MARYELETVPGKALVREYLRKKAWRWFDWDQNYFLKPNDAISAVPLAGGVHDREVVESLRHLAAFLPDRFLDIGANIGLVSMRVAPLVGTVVCVEPNPLICSVLRVNLALNAPNHVVHEFGLGQTDAQVMLHVPRKNLGGAFIKEANEYSAEQLARKDGFGAFDVQNYWLQPVAIRACDAALRELRGQAGTLLVKIDVEGLDAFIIRTMRTVYADLFERGAIAFVFESHDVQLATSLAAELAGLKYGVYGVQVQESPSLRQPVLRRALKLWRGERRHLAFVPLPEVRENVGLTNFVCCPQAFIEK